jgi:hypothetical protein
MKTSTKRIRLGVLLLIAGVFLALYYRVAHPPKVIFDHGVYHNVEPIEVPSFRPDTNAILQAARRTNAINTNTIAHSPPKIRIFMSQLTPAERADFQTNFTKRYQPAIAKWAKAFAGHLPIDPDSITPDTANSRVGLKPDYYQYIFVVKGVTIGVADAKGTAQVVYLNAREQTQKLATLPDGSQTPTTLAPLTAQEIAGMLEADGGGHFAPNEIRLSPSGMAGNLNGGMFAAVGGDSDNAASWKYNLVFGPDGNLAYYAR